MTVTEVKTKVAEYLATGITLDALRVWLVCAAQNAHDYGMEFETLVGSVGYLIACFATSELNEQMFQTKLRSLVGKHQEPSSSQLTESAVQEDLPFASVEVQDESQAYALVPIHAPKLHTGNFYSTSVYGYRPWPYAWGFPNALMASMFFPASLESVFFVENELSGQTKVEPGLCEPNFPAFVSPSQYKVDLQSSR